MIKKQDAKLNKSNQGVAGVKVEVIENSPNNTDPVVRASEPNSGQNETSRFSTPTSQPKEIGGPKGLEPTRYGDWEAKGRCYDF